MKNDALGDRMKRYESVPKTTLMRRTPVIIRLDGKAFHTFTRGFKKPFDKVFVKAMISTTNDLCKNIQGCVFGYTQSDEITLVLCDYQKLETDAWFGYEVQKMCSVVASMCTMYFNKHFKYWTNHKKRIMEDTDDNRAYIDLLESKFDTAMFDARCFNIPKEEVTNCFIWRQQDATRNAIQMLGQTHFIHKELQGKSCNDIQDMLMLQKGINFNDMPAEFKRGVCCIKTEAGWCLDREIPIFTQDRNYVERFINEETE